MLKDNLIVGEEARALLINGIRKCSNVVGGTMGSAGSNVLIEAIEHPGSGTTNDGATILNAIHLTDPIEEMGRKILMEAVGRANKMSGDGSSTTCVLTAAILEEGLKHLEGATPLELKKSLEACVPLIEESINQQKRDITVDEVGQVASISAEDEGIGARIQEIYQQIGKNGIIYWDISKTAEDTYTIGKGITIDGAGYYSPYMCDADASGNNTNAIRIKNAHILLMRQKVSSAADFNTLFESLFNKDIKDIVVFVDEIDPLVIPDLVRTRMMRGFRTVIVKMPVLWKDWWYDDLSKATGAQVIDAVVGLPLKTANISHLGVVENIVITKTDTYIDGIKDLTLHVQQLEEDGSDDAKLRMARLNTKTARYFVGAASDSALFYRRLKVEDAISSSYQALQGGIVAGGGSALAIAANTLSIHELGQDIMIRALLAPAKQISLNATHKNMVIGLDYLDGRGFDSRAREFVDMFKAGIVDPAPVVLNAVKNAVSVAAAIITASSVITLPRERLAAKQP